MTASDNDKSDIISMSAQMSAVTDAVIAGMPDEVQMQELCGLIGNVILRYNMTASDEAIFYRELKKFVRTMREEMAAHTAMIEGATHGTTDKKQ